MRSIMLLIEGVKLGEVGREDTLTSEVEEKRTRDGRVSDRSEVYKLSKVRMSIEGLTNF